MEDKDNQPSLDPDLEGMVKEAVSIAERVPERYREKTFDFFLDAIRNQTSTKKRADDSNSNDPEYIYKLPNEVDVFMKKYKVTREQIDACFSISGAGEIGEIYRLKGQGAAKVQIEIACLKALKQALEDGRFEFSTADVRDACKSMRSFNRGNFSTNFKNREQLFQSFSDKNHVPLSEQGKEWLAGIINELSNTE